MKVLCVGKAVLDVVAYGVSRLPPRYKVLRPVDISLGAGGGAYFSAMVYKGALHSVDVLSAIGTDFSGCVLSQVLTNVGIDVTSFNQSKDFSTIINVVVIDADGNARYLMPELKAIPLGSQNLENFSKTSFDLIHISTTDELLDCDNTELSDWLVTYCSNFPKALVAADLAKSSNNPQKIQDIVSRIDFLFGNEVELRMLCQAVGCEFADEPESILRAVKDLGIRKCVIMKRAERGCSAFDGTRFFHKPALVVPRVRNENGAGDVFSAVFMHEYSLSKDLDHCLSRSNQAAALHIYVPSLIQEFEITGEESLKRTAGWRLATRELSKEELVFPLTVEGYGERFDKTRLLCKTEIDVWCNILEESVGKDVEELVGDNHQKTLLDVCCGTGRFAVPFSEKIGFKVTGIDISEEMLRVAKEKSNSVTWIQANVLHLDGVLPNTLGTFHAAWLSSAINHIHPNFAELLTQIHHQLRQGGRLIIRNVTDELLGEIDWMRHFPKAKSDGEARSVKLPMILNFLLEAGFQVELAKKINLDSNMTYNEFEGRILAKGKTWLCAMSNQDITTCLGEFRSNLRADTFRYQAPKYCIVAVKK